MGMGWCVVFMSHDRSSSGGRDTRNLWDAGNDDAKARGGARPRRRGRHHRLEMNDVFTSTIQVTASAEHRARVGEVEAVDGDGGRWTPVGYSFRVLDSLPPIARIARTPAKHATPTPIAITAMSCHTTPARVCHNARVASANRSPRRAVFFAALSANTLFRRSAAARSCFHHLAASAFALDRARSASARLSCAALAPSRPEPSSTSVSSSSSSNAYEFSNPGRRRQFAFAGRHAREDAVDDLDVVGASATASYARRETGFLSTSYACEIFANVSSSLDDDATSGWCVLASSRYARLISEDVADGETPRRS